MLNTPCALFAAVLTALPAVFAEAPSPTCKQASVTSKDLYITPMTVHKTDSFSVTYRGAISDTYFITAMWTKAGGKQAAFWYMQGKGAQAPSNLKVEFELDSNKGKHAWYLDNPGDCSSLDGPSASFTPSDIKGVKVYWESLK